MKLFNIIKPHHGAICICNSFLGDPRDEEALDRYDIDGSTKMDANYHLYADLELDEPWLEKGAIQTVSALFHNVGDDWKEYLRTRLDA